MKILSQNPNAGVAVGVGTITTMITGTFLLFGIEIPGTLASAYATAIIVGGLYLGRRSRKPAK